MTAVPHVSAKGKRLIGYVRVSKAREEMISPKFQRDTIIAAVEREGATLVPCVDPDTGELVDMIEDLDETGRGFAKRKIQWLIDQVKAGHADGVAVWQVARWGRNTEKSLHHHRLLTEGAGGILLSATEPMGHMKTPMGEFQLIMMFALAQLQSDQISAGWNQVVAHRRGLGLTGNNGKRFGYVFDPEALAHVDLSESGKPPVGVHVPDSVIGPCLADLYADRVDGVTTYQLLTRLNDAGIRSTTGARWTHATLTSMLDSGFGAGLLAVNVHRKASDPPTTYLPGAHEPVIDTDTWVRYQALRSMPKAPRHERAASRLSTLMYCGSCRKMQVRSQENGQPQWVCRSNKGNVHTPCLSRGTMMEHLVIPELVKWVTDLTTDQKWRGEYASGVEHAENIAELVRQCEATEAKLTRRIRNYVRMEADEDMAEDVRPLITKARSERKEVRLRKAQLRSESAPGQIEPPSPTVLKTLVRLLTTDELDVAAANRALAQYIHRIYVHPASRSSRAWAERSSRLEVVGVWERESIS